jgi:hypothetical protein
MQQTRQNQTACLEVIRQKLEEERRADEKARQRQEELNDWGKLFLE